jgi:hypothetical protein
MNTLQAELFTEQENGPKQIKDRTLAILNLAIPFHIIRISRKGLIFRYVGHEQWFSDPGRLDVVLEGFSLRNLPVRTVADYRIPTYLIQTRHHCVRFAGLTPAQEQQLDQFIGQCLQ